MTNKFKQHIAVSLHQTQQDLPASMAQPTPGLTKGNRLTSRKPATSNAPRHIISNLSRKSGSSFKTYTAPLSRKGGEIRVTPVNQPRPMSNKRVTPVNQPRPMSTKKPPKSNSIRKKKKKKEELSSSTRMKKRHPQVEEAQTHLLPIISLITTTMITLIGLSALQVVTPTQVKIFLSN